jgi:hypothetical protein
VHHLGEAIWHAAQTYRQAQTLQVTVVLGHELRQDRYGQALKQDILMGSFTLKRADLLEIRRYMTETAYADHPDQKLLYAGILRTMPHGSSLQ